MEEENDVNSDSSTEEVEVVSEDVNTPESAPAKTEEKVVPYDRFKKVNDELAALKKQPKEVNNTLDVEDYIDISASLDGLDAREKERLAKEHKLTGRPLKEIREDEDFKLWQTAYQAKAERERLALKPSGTQSEGEAPKTLVQKLASASMADKEKILTEAGLYRSPRPRPDRVDLGRGK